jgi:hypothetical protein
VEELARLFTIMFDRGRDGARGPNILAGAEDEIDRLFQ